MRRYIKRIHVCTMNNIGRVRWYEIRCYFDNEDGEERYVRADLSFKEMQRKGIIKTFNSTKKLNDWLETDEGREHVVGLLNGNYDWYTHKQEVTA